MAGGSLRDQQENKTLNMQSLAKFFFFAWFLKVAIRVYLEISTFLKGKIGYILTGGKSLAACNNWR